MYLKKKADQIRLWSAPDQMSVARCGSMARSNRGWPDSAVGGQIGLPTVGFGRWEGFGIFLKKNELI